MKTIGRTAMKTAALCSANPGLLLYRCLDGTGSGEDRDHFAQFTVEANRIYSAERRLYQQARVRHARMLRSLRATHDVLPFRATTNWRLAIGLSYGRVWNIGFQLHPLYGIPFIPAAAWKGAVANCVRETVEQQDPLAPKVFGTKDSQGAAIFFDAFGVPNQETLVEDVVNQHNRPYYDPSGPKGPPADDTEPKPVKFITVRPGTRFHFDVAWPRGVLTAGEADTVGSWIKLCLVEFGVGAKTRRGYGQFKLL